MRRSEDNPTALWANDYILTSLNGFRFRPRTGDNPREPPGLRQNDPILHLFLADHGLKLAAVANDFGAVNIDAPHVVACAL